MKRDRGRITLADPVMALFGIALIVGLGPVVLALGSGLEGPIAALPQMVVAGSALVLLAIMVGRGAGGLR